MYDKEYNTNNSKFEELKTNNADESELKRHVISLNSKN